MNNNFLQPTGFRLVVDRKNYPNLEYFVQAVEHPSVSLSFVDAQYSRISDIPAIGDKIDFDDVTFSLMVDEKMNGYIEILQWMNRLVNKKYTQKNNILNEIPSESDITLIILNSKNVQSRKIQYFNCFPTSIGSISMEAGSTDISVITVPVTFRYTYFEIT